MSRINNLPSKPKKQSKKTEKKYHRLAWVNINGLGIIKNFVVVPLVLLPDHFPILLTLSEFEQLEGKKADVKVDTWVVLRWNSELAQNFQSSMQWSPLVSANFGGNDTKNNVNNLSKKLCDAILETADNLKMFKQPKTFVNLKNPTWYDGDCHSKKNC